MARPSAHCSEPTEPARRSHATRPPCRRARCCGQRDGCAERTVHYCAAARPQAAVSACPPAAGAVVCLSCAAGLRFAGSLAGARTASRALQRRAWHGSLQQPLSRRAPAPAPRPGATGSLSSRRWSGWRRGGRASAACCTGWWRMASRSGERLRYFTAHCGWRGCAVLAPWKGFAALAGGGWLRPPACAAERCACRWHLLCPLLVGDGAKKRCAAAVFSSALRLPGLCTGCGSPRRRGGAARAPPAQPPAPALRTARLASPTPWSPPLPALLPALFLQACHVCAAVTFFY